MGFVFAEPEVTEDQARRVMAWWAAVDFQGPVSGSLEIGFSGSLATELTANMLGAEPPVEVALIGDALGEIANVVCGNLVPSLGRPEDVFHLGAPRVEAANTRPSASTPPAAQVAIGAGEGRAEFTLHLAGPIPEPVGAP